MFRTLILSLTLGVAAGAADRELMVCGWDEVYILNIGSPAAAPAKVWSWKAAERPELPARLVKNYRTTDDCKPVSGDRVLITASSNGVALVERATGKTVFWASCANAHSAEMLPGERIVVACSVQPEGNRLAVFDARVPERELYSTELYSGHGAVWDGGRKLLWALGGKELRAYSLAEWDTRKPSLRLAASYPLPDPDGHELHPVAGSSMLVVTTGRKVWSFDRDARTFSPHPDLGDLRNIKSVSVHPQTKQLAYTQGENPNWWTSSIRFLHPAATLKRDGEKIYKVRWVK
jgi:hypothetical protein